MRGHLTAVAFRDKADPEASRAPAQDPAAPEEVPWPAVQVEAAAMAERDSGAEEEVVVVARMPAAVAPQEPVDLPLLAARTPASLAA